MLSVYLSKSKSVPGAVGPLMVLRELLCGPPIPISCLLLCERERSALSGAGLWLVVSVFLLSCTDQEPWRCFQADGAVQTNGKVGLSMWSSGHHAQGTLVQRIPKPWGGRGR